MRFLSIFKIITTIAVFSRLARAMSKASAINVSDLSIKKNIGLSNFNAFIEFSGTYYFLTNLIALRLLRLRFLFLPLPRLVKLGKLGSSGKCDRPGRPEKCGKRGRSGKLGRCGNFGTLARNSLKEKEVQRTHDL